MTLEFLSYVDLSGCVRQGAPCFFTMLHHFLRAADVYKRQVQGTAQMKQYDVKISHAALNDMEQIYSYIADRLLEPDTAMGDVYKRQPLV